jgi:hypothetical protein
MSFEKVTARERAGAADGFEEVRPEVGKGVRRGGDGGRGETWWRGCRFG